MFFIFLKKEKDSMCSSCSDKQLSRAKQKLDKCRKYMTLSRK